MEQWQLETAGRLARIEEMVKHIEEHVKNRDLEKRVQDLESFKQQVLQRIAWVSGAFAVISSALVYALDYAKNHLTLN